MLKVSPNSRASPPLVDDFARLNLSAAAAAANCNEPLPPNPLNDSGDPWDTAAPSLFTRDVSQINWQERYYQLEAESSERVRRLQARIAALEAENFELINSVATHAEESVPTRVPGRLWVVQNVHQDDIHTITKLGDGTFVTGSKDGSLKKWSCEGKWLRTIQNPRYNYKQWFTALATLNNKFFISGTRDGEAHLWDNEGNHVKDLAVSHATFPQGFVRCKPRNMDRVNCLSSFENATGQPHFLAGWATQFTWHSYESLKRLQYTHTSDNDWVYAIQPVTDVALLVITGCRLDLYRRARSNRWDLDVRLVTEPPGSSPRPYISAITPLQDAPARYSIAVFDGSVRVIDIEARTTIFYGQEHKNRVWAVENIAPHCIASCADDGLIKFWDLRRPFDSYCTILDNEEEKARVSVLTLLQNGQLLSGSCPDNVREARNKARFSFWDIRYMG